VIVTVCLLVIAGIAAAGSHQMVSPDGADVLAQRHVAVQADPPAREMRDEVPISLWIRNAGDMDDRLLGGSTPVAESVGVRRAFLVSGRRVTTPAPDGIVIPADATMTLEPGASYLALFGMRTALVQGQTFPLTLRFDRSGEVTVIARVRRRVDAAGIAPLPGVSVDGLTIALVSAPPAPGP
jgi:copper(I)-binding protein